ncbi:N-terminal domain of molybdenum-binding protein [Halapricum desulfuricans]|uniref:N-terminal domain of molybdenum-binding protein n=1 Tax=Halapricum desulfuricans TaxID=2841257 RepID=A0A897NK65_9EURY|nr:TOBE domain-containing protein [Halapricum desulfuricans]QSG11259.1 N-terminal domain of molybdenum-binding protein [Halapricum desulfuricans]
MSRYGGESPSADFAARLYADGVAFEDRDAALLRAVAETGSLNAAAQSLGRSYSRAHKRLSTLEDAFGPLLDRQRGGASGGGSELTDLAETLLARFDRLRAEYSGVAETDETVLEGRVVERTGELGVVETDAGELRALVEADAETVQVSIRADAVTLQSPDAAPMAAETSARNRLSGTVTDIDAGEAVATVTVDVGAERPLAALVTCRSLELLDLAVGDPVVASLKAMTIRAIPQ